MAKKVVAVLLTVSAAIASSCLCGCGPSSTSSVSPAKQKSQSSSQPQSAESSKSPDYARYSIQAEKVVSKFLKHPLDAKFNPGMLNVADVVPVGNEGQVRVSGTVVAKNDFGGELTNTYAVLFTKDLDVVAVSLDGEVVYVAEDKSAEEEESPRDEFRMWMDDTGQHSVEAVFVEFKGGKVHLRKRDGKIVELSPSRLSDNDNRWYKDELKRRKAEERNDTRR